MRALEHSTAAGGAVAIVTGGTRGIGAAIVDRLARRGFDVLAVHRGTNTAPDYPPVTSPGRVVAFRCDVTDADAPQRIFDAADELGDPVVLVNNAGITGAIGPLRTVSDETMRAVIDVDLIATMRLSREAVARWETRAPRDDRSIVNVSSIAARTGAPGEYVWYAAAKAGVNAFTVGLAGEVAGRGVRVNAVNPGTTTTTIHERAGRPHRAAEVGARSPLGRPADVQEIAAAVDWLVSTEASYVTGTVLDVSGGVR